MSNTSINPESLQSQQANEVVLTQEDLKKKRAGVNYQVRGTN
jgi:hypothetical protein